MKPSFARLLPAAVLLIVAGVVVTLLRTSPLPGNPAPAVGTAPGLPAAGLSKLMAARFDDSAGRPQALAQWSGKVLVVNFWATWCPPCRAEMPDFSRLQTRYADRGVQFVGLGIDSPSAIKEYALQTPVSYPLLIAGNAGLDLAEALGNARGAMPHTIVLDRHGTFVAERYGRWDARDLEAVLQTALN